MPGMVPFQDMPGLHPVAKNASSVIFPILKPTGYSQELCQG